MCPYETTPIAALKPQFHQGLGQLLRERARHLLPSLDCLNGEMDVFARLPSLVCWVKCEHAMKKFGELPTMFTTTTQR